MYLSLYIYHYMILSILDIYIILYIISVQFRQMLGLQQYLFSPATLRVSCWQRSRGPRLLPQNPSVSTDVHGQRSQTDKLADHFWTLNTYNKLKQGLRYPIPRLVIHINWLCGPHVQRGATQNTDNRTVCVFPSKDHQNTKIYRCNLFSTVLFELGCKGSP